MCEGEGEESLISDPSNTVTVHDIFGTMYRTLSSPPPHICDPFSSAVGEAFEHDIPWAVGFSLSEVLMDGWPGGGWEGRSQLCYMALYHALD